MTRIFRKINRYIPAVSLVISFIALISLGINIAYIVSENFADIFNVNVSSHIRVFMAHLTGWIPFSLAEFVVLSAPVILAAVIAVSVKKASRGTRYFIRCIAGLLSILLFFYSAFVFVFGAGYRTSALDKKLGLQREKVSAADLYNTIMIVIDRLNELEDEVMYIEAKGSVRPYSHEKTTRLCIDSYN